MWDSHPTAAWCKGGGLDEYQYRCTEPWPRYDSGELSSLVLAGSVIAGRQTLAWHIQQCLQKYARMHFEIIGDITDIEPIATGPSIRILPFLRKHYGRGRWRKLKGKAVARLADGTVRRAELHWFEAHGIGKRKIRIKRFLD